MNKLVRKFNRKGSYNMQAIFLFLGANRDKCFTYATEISTAINMANSTVSDNITKIKGEGLIDVQFKLTEKGQRLFNILWKNIDSDQLRFHNIQIRFMLASCPVDYIKRYSDMILKLISNDKYNGFKANLSNATMMMYSRKKIICVLKDVYGYSEEDIVVKLQLIVQELQDEIETKFRGIKITSHDFCKIQTSHLAIVDSKIAESVSKNGKFTYEGKTIAIDKSHGRYEIELTDSKTNLANISDLIEFERKINQDE